MTLQETVDFLMLMSAYYPTWKPSISVEMIATAWSHDLKNYTLDEVNAAFSIYRSQGNQFPPAQPGVLINLLVENADDSIGEGEAWAIVCKAKRNGNYGAQEEFDKFPEDIQRAVGSPATLRDWALAPPESSTVIQSNFLRAYRAVLKRKKEDALIDPNVKKMLERKNQELLEG